MNEQDLKKYSNMYVKIGFRYGKNINTSFKMDFGQFKFGNIFRFTAFFYNLRAYCWDCKQNWQDKRTFFHNC